MKLSRLFALGAPLGLLSGVVVLQAHLQAEEAGAEAPAAKGEKMLAHDEVTWTPLNPARGDQSPQAANLWGDRAREGATGFLVTFREGFASPPHIHNVTYRGVVLAGEIHNDDPAAAKMWMPAGSYWTQPAGEDHITAARGERNVAYIEIDSGPYLVLPSAQATDNGERPVNVHADNIVWLDSSESTRIVGSGEGPSPEVALLWVKDDEGRSNGSLLKLPPGFVGSLGLAAGGGELRLVVVEGAIVAAGEGADDPRELRAGSYWGSGRPLSLRVPGEGEGAILYLRSSGRYLVRSE
ncbi:DUF4437 domain-containing protein [Roseibacillus ishigakijimensis]|uniref:DUF4437 domain-containing protein n=1 Tax=Roseibacillus ishigakijimensis TaxID=454146 RepID=A0A934VM87_9BACT|nr:DUF4437 domain-containing protein [Roseibacillus ishigakijimensis]MBK1833836.1 DUF4437 domain-containing protein [Roseibacillus ishigakijimensis]